HRWHQPHRVSTTSRARICICHSQNKLELSSLSFFSNTSIFERSISSSSSGGGGGNSSGIHNGIGNLERCAKTMQRHTFFFSVYQSEC
ncbi:hypothetical protein NL474_28520, partial [Klebsiella pneumoniae]|nr:hypothetical protein [Klebsiella pneumoniae]